MEDIHGYYEYLGNVSQLTRVSSSKYIDECYRARKKDYHQKLRLYHLDKNVNMFEVENKLQLNTLNIGETEKVNNAYEYFTLEGLPGSCSVITHYDKHYDYQKLL